MPTNQFRESSSSLIARAGQIMAVIITLGLISMISSMLVTESLNGDAAKINDAGALRMQAIRVSRAYYEDKSVNKTQIQAEIDDFNRRLSTLSLGQHVDQKDPSAVARQYQDILNLWQQANEQPLTLVSLSTQQLTQQSKSYDRFVIQLNKLVSLLQLESEKKLSLLRLIQGLTLLLVIAVASFVLIKLNRMIIIPLTNLVEVAKQVGKGNFEVKANDNESDELGLLATTINQMSSELKLTYQEFEYRVDEKTLALRRSNQSLDILYRAARNLAGYSLSEQNSDSFQIDNQIIAELEVLIGIGKIRVNLENAKQDNLAIDIVYSKNTAIDKLCFNYCKFPLEKQNVLFGYLLWETPTNTSIHDWQKQILQGMADIIATAIELDQKRLSENRLVIVEERAVIARELHDSLAQSLSYLKVQMSLLTRKMQKQLPQAQVEETIDDIKAGLNSAYLQLRELLTTFRLKLEDPVIKHALLGTITEFSAKCQHRIEFNYQLPANYLSANQEIHLLQIVREALSNIHRHANANRAGVSIQLIKGKVTVQIWDDGQGLPESLTKQSHFGISIMTERAISLNADIQLSARKGAGTLVSFEFSH
ncbi:MAG: type IV pili methyl-accepting chemotaxis transducer N-terminal domain-containing protein [Colwellia sp.]|nr:type IV pili methyl-accepting chemotaxis transducer N-terminal domain-containing protein [Colwellia sp.]